VWLLASATDGNEDDDFGFIHGLKYLPTDFTPRPVFEALQNTNALFSDTKLDPALQLTTPDASALRSRSGGELLTYGFRARSGKAIVAYWLAAHSRPGNVFPALSATFTLKGSSIKHPVLIDVVSGKITPLEWKGGAAGVLESLPVRDSIMAIADEDYFDWPVLPEAPSSLNADTAGGSVKLTWEVHGGDATGIAVERRVGESAKWDRIATLAGTGTEYSDSAAGKGIVSYRVRALNGAGESAYSNIIRTTPSGGD